MDQVVGDLPTCLDELVFPTKVWRMSGVTSSIKLSKMSIKNRLTSIQEDAVYVQKVAEMQGLPLVANERCGSWYIPLEKKATSVYFKSTDGHYGQWKFSLRRLNLHMLDVIGQNDGYRLANPHSVEMPLLTTRRKQVV